MGKYQPKKDMREHDMLAVICSLWVVGAVMPTLQRQKTDLYCNVIKIPQTTTCRTLLTMTLRHIQARLGMERKPDENLLKNKLRIPPNIAQNSCENHPWASQPSPNDTSITTACTNFIAYGRQLASRICLHCAMRLALCSVPDSAYWTLDLLAIIFV